jgi:hypothetical protein
MFKEIIKVIALGLGLSLAAMVPVAMSAETLDSLGAKIDALTTNLGTNVGKKLDQQNELLAEIRDALKRGAPAGVTPAPIAVQPPTRVVYIHRHYYPRYWPWCPPPWFGGY